MSVWEYKPVKCAYCDYWISTHGCYMDVMLTGIFGYLYCDIRCRDWHIESK